MNHCCTNLPFFAFVGFGVSNEGPVYEINRNCDRDEEAIACIGFDIVLNADIVMYSDSDIQLIRSWRDDPTL